MVATPSQRARAARPAAPRRGGGDLSDLLSYRLSVVSNLLSRNLLARLAPAADVSLHEWRVLVLVASYGPVPVKSLARHAGLDFGHASRLVSALCAEGYIAKHPAPDRRSSALTLTARGRALHRKLWRLAMRCNDEFVASLSAAQHRTLVGALDILASVARASLAHGSPQ